MSQMQNKLNTMPEKSIVCKKCGQELPGDSMFCEYCGSAINSEKRVDEADIKTSNIGNSDSSEKRKKRNTKVPIIVLSILLSIALIGLIFGGYFYYLKYVSYNKLYDDYASLNTNYNSLYYDKSSLQLKYNNLDTKYTNLETKYSNLQNDYNQKCNNTLFDDIVDGINDVKPTDYYGGFDSRIYTVKKGQSVTINFPYSYSGDLWCHYGYGYDCDWQTSYTYGYCKLKITGKSVGVYELEVNKSETSGNGITTLIYVYE